MEWEKSTRFWHREMNNRGVRIIQWYEIDQDANLLMISRSCMFTFSSASTTWIFFTCSLVNCFSNWLDFSFNCRNFSSKSSASLRSKAALLLKYCRSFSRSFFWCSIWWWQQVQWSVVGWLLIRVLHGYDFLNPSPTLLSFNAPWPYPTKVWP